MKRIFIPFSQVENQLIHVLVYDFETYDGVYHTIRLSIALFLDRNMLTKGRRDLNGLKPENFETMLKICRLVKYQLIVFNKCWRNLRQTGQMKPRKI